MTSSSSTPAAESDHLSYFQSCVQRKQSETDSSGVSPGTKPTKPKPSGPNKLRQTIHARSKSDYDRPASQITVDPIPTGLQLRVAKTPTSSNIAQAGAEEPPRFSSTTLRPQEG